MTITPERLAALADGELDELEAARVRREIAADPELAAQLAEHETLRAMLSAHYAPILAQPVPQQLTKPIVDAAKVVDLGAVREARQRWFERPATRYFAGPAIAASLVMAILVGRVTGPTEQDYAKPQLARVLDTSLSGEVAADGTEVLLSFRDQAGQACRAWSGRSESGIACRDAKGWKVRQTGAARQPGSGEYQQAGSGDAAVLAAVQEMASGSVLDHAQEKTARAAGWKAAD